MGTSETAQPPWLPVSGRALKQGGEDKYLVKELSSSVKNRWIKRLEEKVGIKGDEKKYIYKKVSLFILVTDIKKEYKEISIFEKEALCKVGQSQSLAVSMLFKALGKLCYTYY